MATMIPKPDHPEANRLGCSCPNAGNANGTGRVVDNDTIKTTIWIVNPTCKLHAKPSAWFERRGKKEPLMPKEENLK